MSQYNTIHSINHLRMLYHDLMRQLGKLCEKRKVDFLITLSILMLGWIFDAGPIYPMYAILSSVFQALKRNRNIFTCI